jgi:hypothetical protein
MRRRSRSMVFADTPRLFAVAWIVKPAKSR